MSNVLPIDFRAMKTPASRARVGALASATVERLRQANCRREAETEWEGQQSKVLADLEMSMRKAVAFFGDSAAETWIGLMGSKVLARVK